MTNKYDEIKVSHYNQKTNKKITRNKNREKIVSILTTPAAAEENTKAGIRTDLTSPPCQFPAKDHR